MAPRTRTELDALMAQIEEMERHLGTLFDHLNAIGGWGQRHGPDWIFSDVPYHLAYCHRDLVARGLELGADVPKQEQELLTSPAELNAWNARKFAERPADQTAAQSLAQWRAAGEQIRRLTAQMADAELARPFWMPIYRGWATARDGLEFCRNHDWSEFMQLRIHMRRSEPVPSAEITRAYLGFMLQFFPMFLNREAAAGKAFTAVMAFTDPGVGAWTIRVADGNATIDQGEAPDADLVMTQSAETFEKTLRHIHDPAEAIRAGAIQVSKFEALATFGQLFPM